MAARVSRGAAGHVKLRHLKRRERQLLHQGDTPFTSDAVILDQAEDLQLWCAATAKRIGQNRCSFVTSGWVLVFFLIDFRLIAHALQRQ